MALFEVLPVGAALQELIAAGASAAELRGEAAAIGHRGLRQVGLVHVADGQIALEDLLRATGDHLA